MKTPRNLFGREFADYLIHTWRYVESHQTGSHIILRSTASDTGSLSVPAHKPLRVGTLNALIRLACEQRGISRDTLLRDL